ncbi:hypothetical protein Mp_4g11850 [Marchantia polymorpha subsp. ruderalis]|uniref:Uncharacterized protein n=2 Tax=Marchantia polymorpha TaxID=3197 RepID=A0AAF6B8Y8_MARPO|nr:hypothetical protein MARPO_0011s0170 [Marchantia polymorpha]BBN08472.1 hypothetical protein Mp_4g11850 [Marchantia polymorpha subsp. ruderalis]|eukprot:PTQ46509.1 hypothetical protein MARPO_0011s0170 [Marchantia polymorpha]
MAKGEIFPTKNRERRGLRLGLKWLRGQRRTGSLGGKGERTRLIRRRRGAVQRSIEHRPAQVLMSALTSITRERGPSVKRPYAVGC